MAKKSKIARRKAKKRNSSPSKSSQLTSEIADFGIRAGAGFAGYTANRFLSRAVFTTMAKKNPKLAKALAVAAGFGGAFGIHFAGEKIEKIADYKDEILLGAAIAAIQTAGQAYLPPRLNWIISDHFEGKYAADLPAEKKEATSAFTADALAGILPPLDDPAPASAAPSESQRALPEPAMSDFDLESFMTANGLEAEEVGRTDPAPGYTEDMGVTEEEAYAEMESWGDSFGSGMLN